jgi:beta-barrel assembly-enhancing protease
MVGAKALSGEVPLMSVRPRLLPSLREVPYLSLALCLSFVLTGNHVSAQTASAPIASPAVADSALSGGSDLFGWWTPVRRNPLQADPRVVAVFLRPWLLSARALNFAEAALVPPSSLKGARALPTPKTYTLTPDPLNWPIASDSPDEDDFAYVPDLPRPGPVTTAQRLAEAGHVTKPPQHLAAKLDVTRIGDRQIGEGINFYSIDKEIALGRQMSLEVEQSTRLFPDPVINEYVNRIGQVLVQHSDCKVPFIIKVVDDDEVNAFALPGGFFYVDTGVILAADDEAELAGVMAHEIAHVCARHATRNVTKSEIAQYASLPLIFFGGPVGYAVRQVASIAMPLSFLKFSRDAEREADLLGMQYQYAAGYDPTAFVDFFEKLESEEKGSNNFVARAFMTHPMTQDRVRSAEHELEMLPDRESYITDTSEFDQIRDRLYRLVHGHSFAGGQRPHPTLRHRNGSE